jgi:hypothetical protein
MRDGGGHTGGEQPSRQTDRIPGGRGDRPLTDAEVKRNAGIKPTHRDAALWLRTGMGSVVLIACPMPSGLRPGTEILRPRPHVSNVP